MSFVTSVAPGGGGGAVSSVNGQTGVVVLTTTDVAEGSNLYYTSTRFNSALATKTTSDLAEGSNLYYTTSRFNTSFGTKSTSDLSEGSNLYFTEPRVLSTALTGFSSGAGTVSSADTILQAINKLDGNVAAKQPLDPQLTSLANLSYTSNALKVVRVNAGETDFELATLSSVGDVVGPGSATDNAVARFDGTTGKLIQNSAVTIGDSGETSISLSGAGSLVGLTVDNGSNTGKVIDLKIAGTSHWGMGSSGSLKGSWATQASRNGESNPYGLYSLVVSNSGASGNAYSGTGTFAGYFSAGSSAATSANFGVVSYVYQGNNNVGIYGIADSNTGSSPRNFGVIGTASLGSTPTSYSGGHFFLTTTSSTTLGASPTNVTAALSANNGGTTANILQLQDNGTNVFTVADGGAVTTTGAVNGATPTEMGYLSGVTSAIQTQLSAKAPTASPAFTGVVAVPAGGSDSAPTYTFTGDTNTGFYQSAADTMRWVVGGNHVASVSTTLYTINQVLKVTNAILGNGYDLGADSSEAFYRAWLDNGITLRQAGANISIKEGSNASMGVATLSGGTVTVNTNKATSSGRIFLTHQNNSGTVGFVTVSSRSAGTSFTITSSSATDTSDIAWIIVEPA